MYSVVAIPVARIGMPMAVVFQEEVFISQVNCESDRCNP